MDGIIQHSYFNASDAPSQWEAEQVNRQAVTVAFAYEHLVDQPLYLHNPKLSTFGLDPWTIVAGIDREGGQTYIVEHGNDRSVKVGPAFQIFAQRDTLRKLGFQIPETKRKGLRKEPQ